MTEAQLRNKIRHEIMRKRVDLAMLLAQIDETRTTDVLKRNLVALDERVSTATFKLMGRYR